MSPSFSPQPPKRRRIPRTRASPLLRLLARPAPSPPSSLALSSVPSSLSPCFSPMAAAARSSPLANLIHPSVAALHPRSSAGSPTSSPRVRCRLPAPRLRPPGRSDGHLLPHYRSTPSSPCSHGCPSMVVFFEKRHKGPAYPSMVVLLLTRASELVTVGPRSPSIKILFRGVGPAPASLPWRPPRLVGSIDLLVPSYEANITTWPACLLVMRNNICLCAWI